ncbi:Mu transposase domain-containing protein [Rhodococcus opacus]|uniref:Mu transposase domain-containing protein n=1 Tax=Rhodococcus opacus TaxID=37919 RepID=UPI003CD0241D
MNPPRHARTILRNSQYSVSARLIGLRVWVLVRSNEVIVLDGRTVIARRVRSTHPWCAGPRPRPEVLKIKPGALPWATALRPAGACGNFTAAYEAFLAGAAKPKATAPAPRS